LISDDNSVISEHGNLIDFTGDIQFMKGAPVTEALDRHLRT